MFYAQKREWIHSRNWMDKFFIGLIWTAKHGIKINKMLRTALHGWWWVEALRRNRSITSRHLILINFFSVYKTNSTPLEEPNGHWSSKHPSPRTPNAIVTRAAWKLDQIYIAKIFIRQMISLKAIHLRVIRDRWIVYCCWMKSSGLKMSPIRLTIIILSPKLSDLSLHNFYG